VRGPAGIRQVAAGAVALAAASALLWCGYHFVREAPMFSWTNRTAPGSTVAEPRSLPPIDLAMPASVETATFAVG